MRRNAAAAPWRDRVPCSGSGSPRGIAWMSFRADSMKNRLSPSLERLAPPDWKDSPDRACKQKRLRSHAAAAWKESRRALSISSASSRRPVRAMRVDPGNARRSPGRYAGRVQRANPFPAAGVTAPLSSALVKRPGRFDRVAQCAVGRRMHVNGHGATVVFSVAEDQPQTPLMVPVAGRHNAQD